MKESWLVLISMHVSYRLDTLEQAELQYKKKEKKTAPEGWDVFNSKALYDAYLKRADKVGDLLACHVSADLRRSSPFRAFLAHDYCRRPSFQAAVVPSHH